MARRIAAAILLMIPLGSCGDLSPDEVHEYLTIHQGGTFSGTTESDDSYTGLSDGYDLNSELEDLPAGFTFIVDDDYIDGGGRLTVEYTLRIAPWTPTGAYHFKLKYRIRADSPDDDFFDSLLEAPDEVEFKFQVVVSPQPAGHPPPAVVIRGVRVEDPDQDTTLIILE